MRQRLNNLPSEDKERLLSGDIRHLRDLLHMELEAAKEFMIDCPLNKLEETRGSCGTLREIIKLLP